MKVTQNISGNFSCVVVHFRTKMEMPVFPNFLLTEVKEIFRGLIPCHYDGDLDFYREWSEWFDCAAGLNIDEIYTVAYMFKRHLQGILNAFVTKTNNGKAERMNGAIQELKTIGRGFRNAERFRITILFFHGKLNMDRS